MCASGTIPEKNLLAAYEQSSIIKTMQPLKKHITALLADVEAAFTRLALDEKTAQLAAIETELAGADVWQDNSNAQAKSKQQASLQKQIEPWQRLKKQLLELNELADLDDQTLLKECESQLETLEKTFHKLKKDLQFSGEYDSHGVIMRISAGVGGTDAQDWAEMLERMYLRFAEKNDYTATIIERSVGEEAGLKTSVLEISGPFAYGKLQSEHGVHRLVRLSPFNSDNLRQTSFALVEILPDIDTPDKVKLDDKDLKIDVYRAGGHGGQSVNTTDSAVRITHLPTGLTVAIQNERSQLQNRETALKIIRSKLAQLQLEQHAESIAELKAGESANWGSQIRNYVLHPYTMVKDTRTKYQETDAAGVLDGKIDGFITAYLDKLVQKA